MREITDRSNWSFAVSNSMALSGGTLQQRVINLIGGPAEHQLSSAVYSHGQFSTKYLYLPVFTTKSHWSDSRSLVSTTVSGSSPR